MRPGRMWRRAETNGSGQNTTNGPDSSWHRGRDPQPQAECITAPRPPVITGLRHGQGTPGDAKARLRPSAAGGWGHWLDVVSCCRACFCLLDNLSLSLPFFFFFLPVFRTLYIATPRPFPIFLSCLRQPHPQNQKGRAFFSLPASRWILSSSSLLPPSIACYPLGSRQFLSSTANEFIRSPSVLPFLLFFPQILQKISTPYIRAGLSAPAALTEARSSRPLITFDPFITLAPFRLNTALDVRDSSLPAPCGLRLLRASGAIWLSLSRHSGSSALQSESLSSRIATSPARLLPPRLPDARAAPHSAATVRGSAIRCLLLFATAQRTCKLFR
jgi:hypothetical protein